MKYSALFALPLTFLPAQAQEMMNPSNGAVRLLNADLAVLETREVRTDLPCTVTPIKPELGFDLKLHAGYRATLPFEEVPAGTDMVVIVRVHRNNDDEPVHMRQKLVSSPRGGQSTGIGAFEGFFAVGEGDYQVDWLMRDRSGRVCSQFWTIKAEFPEKFKRMATMSPGRIQTIDPDPFHNEPLEEKNSMETLPRVTVLLNFAPLDPTASYLSDRERNALLDMLRTIIRDPRIGRTSLTVFNLEQQKILYSEHEQIDFREMEKSVESLKLGTVSAKALEDKNSSADFLAKLIEETTSKDPAPAALVFVGPAGGTSVQMSAAMEGLTNEKQVQLFYLTYNPIPAAAPWGDIISKVVHLFKGRDYSIRQPRDMLIAWSDMMGRISVGGRNGQASAFQAVH